MSRRYTYKFIELQLYVSKLYNQLKARISHFIQDEQGDVPGWVLVVLMTTGLVTAIWTIAQPRISTILRNSLDNMNNIR
jgi:uncharacterized membrane protein YqjE